MNQKLEASVVAREKDAKIAKEWQSKVINENKKLQKDLVGHEMSQEEMLI